jgi:pyridoxal 5'-phosphate synthase pdxT subunit
LPAEDTMTVPGAAARAAGRPATAGPLIGVLALQGDVAEHMAALAAADARPVLVRRPAELAAVDGLVIPGGESTAIWKLAVIFDLAEPLRERVAAGMPVFGSCAGMIMLASRLTDHASDQETLGAIDMTVRRNAFGRQADSFESDLALRDVPGPPFRAVFIRAPWVEQAGPEVEVLATEPRTGRIVAVREGPALATAFHPELTKDTRVHEIFTDMVRERS